MELNEVYLKNWQCGVEHYLDAGGQWTIDTKELAAKLALLASYPLRPGDDRQPVRIKKKS